MGKSTFARTYLSSFPYINGDEIKRQAELSGQRIDSFGLRTAVQSKINNHIFNKESFALESNLVSNYSFEIVPEVTSKGYHTSLFYLGAEDLSVLNARIQQRVAEGLHFVSPQDVKERYQEALTKLPLNLKYFDKAVFLDNSVQGIDPTEVLELKKGIIEWRKDPLPFWLNNIFPIIEKLSKAYSKMNLR